MRYSFLLIVLLGLSFIACEEDPILIEEEEQEEEGPVEEPGSYKILSLGDSYTIGHSVSASMRFPAQLADSLTLRGYSIDTLDIVATTGWTTDDLLRGIDRRTDLKESYDIVTLLIGVNNQYRNFPILRFIQEFTELLDTAVSYAGGDKDKVIVVSIPDYAYTPFGGGSPGISQDIELYNDTKRGIATGRGFSFIEITDISRLGLAQPNLVASDGLHPSGLQYTRWVERILPVAEEKLRK